MTRHDGTVTHRSRSQSLRGVTEQEILGTCESLAFESNIRIEYFQLQRILVTKISNYK